MYKEERNMFNKEMREINEWDMGNFGALDSPENFYPRI